MIYKIVISFVILNLLSEYVEIIFPSKFMNQFVKSVVSMIFLYSFIRVILNAINVFIF